MKNLFAKSRAARTIGEMITGRVVQTHTFLYVKGTLKLDFTLATDTLGELQDFKMMLENGADDVEKLITKIKKQRELGV